MNYQIKKVKENLFSDSIRIGFVLISKKRGPTKPWIVIGLPKRKPFDGEPKEINIQIILASDDLIKATRTEEKGELFENPENISLNYIVTATW